MSAGRPVVTSPAVAEGLGVQLQQELLVAEKPKEWFLALDLLLSDRSMSKTLGRHARQAMTDRFTWNQVAQHMLAVVRKEPTPPKLRHHPSVDPQLS
jgi:glycosyltransferase involved in cell wall biosynthesis